MILCQNPSQAIASHAKGAADITLTDVIESRLELAKDMGYNVVNVRGKNEKEILEELGGKFDSVIGSCCKILYFLTCWNKVVDKRLIPTAPLLARFSLYTGIAKRS